jgi:GNAT superfamily N-acetyltransferase
MQMENVMNRSTQFESSYRSFAAHAGDVVRVYDSIKHLDAFYPAFERWYWGTVVPGLADGTRLLETVIRDGELVGILIAKRNKEERKLCTLWVHRKFAGSGVGVRLIRAGCEWVGSSTPLATVPEERMSEFGDLLPRLGFELTQVVQSYYRDGKAEYVFNGQLVRPHS